MEPPLCPIRPKVQIPVHVYDTTEQLAGLMGGVTRRRANQMLRSLRARSLVHSENQRHVLRGEGLRYLALRDRAAVRLALGLWSARWRRRRGTAPVIAGTALRSLDSQMRHQDAINTVVASLSAESAREGRRNGAAQPRLARRRKVNPRIEPYIQPAHR